MKKLNIFFLFLFVFLIYFFFATRFTMKPVWSLEYFNQLTASLLVGEFNIKSPAVTHDLAFFNGKWYAPYGPLPSILLTPIQIIKGRFVPIVYLSVFLASITVVVFHLILLRIKNDFLPKLSNLSILALTLFFAFGTVMSYVSTTTSIWFVQQTTTTFFATLGIFFIFKKKRATHDYFLSTLMFSITLLGRGTNFLLILLPLLLFIFDNRININSIKKSLIVFGVPFVMLATLFFGYNWARFGSFTEYGYNYIHEAKKAEENRLKYGTMSLKYLPMNLKHMVFELPQIDLKNFNIKFSLEGNSIFFLSPPLLAAFLASPLIRKKSSFKVDPYIAALWICALTTIVPTLLWYGTGWMQFSYRYSLDITALLVILSIFGIKGRLNALYFLGIVFSFWMYFLGIRSMW